MKIKIKHYENSAGDPCEYCHRMAHYIIEGAIEMELCSVHARSHPAWDKSLSRRDKENQHES